MSATRTSRFASALADAGVTCTTTTATDAAAAIADAATDPAVGTSLPFEGVSLPTGVETDPTTADLEAAATGVTAARLGIVEYGSVVLESTPEGSEPASLYPETHVVVVAASDVVDDMATGIDRIAERVRETGRDQIIATGPSATADMGDLVLGAHGPESVHAVLLEDR